MLILPEIQSTWINHKNDTYTVIGITNIHADEERRKDWPVHIVYVGTPGLIWSMPLSMWFHKMREYPSSNPPKYGEPQLTLQEVLDETPDPYKVVSDLVNHVHSLSVQVNALCARLEEQNSLNYALSVIKNHVAEDDDYAWAWHSNAAMACVDAGAEHTVANYGAVRFMKTLFDVDTEPLLERAGIQQPERTSELNKTSPEYIYERVVATADRAVEWLFEKDQAKAKELVKHWQDLYLIEDLA